jgi:aryl-alcohol dehydrogenase-like predicted oxidoreductase
MLSRPIPSTGEPVPVIGLGTWKVFDVAGSTSVRAGPKAVLDEFVKLGGTVVDSSPMYGRSEQVIGDLSRELGVTDRLFMATKVWTTGREKGIAEMRESMRRMNVTRMDLMQVHNLVDVDTHLQTLASWKADGLVRYVGITHYTASAHAEVGRVLDRHSVDFLQINYSVIERDVERWLLPMAKERGIAVIVNRPLATGELTQQLRRRPLPTIATELQCATWAELLLKFVVSHPVVTCAIPATGSVEHLRQNMAAGSDPMPTDRQRLEIAKAVTG